MAFFKVVLLNDYRKLENISRPISTINAQEVMIFLKKKISGLRKRLKCLSYGILYLRNNEFHIPNTFLINWRKRNLKFIDSQEGGFVYEFNEICLNDCYCLARLKKGISNVTSIVDIGANQGLFAIAARTYFPHASISCYEPNKQLEAILTNNTEELNAIAYYEAVTKDNCKVKLEFRESSLHTTTQHSEEGIIKGTALREIINRAGGKIDILKMDCEGGEWEIFEDESSFRQIQGITMEYHLWAKQGSSATGVAETLKRLGFEIIFHAPLSEKFGLITAVKPTTA